ncbi:MAG: type II/IV secretion system protein [Candidatus Liptonbacteria bacterium]|nr:type II/IV secretion system protein [Candidatus Liptonbacteria bacterium]
MDPKLLLEELKKRDLVDESTAKRLFRDVDVSKKPLEEMLYERKLVSDEQVAKLKSEILKIPYKKVDIQGIPAAILNLIPEETVLAYKVVPISKTKDLLTVGMLYPDDEKAKEVLQFMGKQNRVDLGVYIITKSDYDLALRRYNPYLNEINAALKFIQPGDKKDDAPSRKVVSLDEGSSQGEEAPIIKIVATTLREAVTRQASDIHIEPQRNRLRIRFRLDGNLQEVLSLPIQLHQPIVSRIKVISNLQIDETRRPQDGRFRTVIMDRDIDFRVATFPTPLGEKAALRVLDPTVGLKGLDELGLHGPNMEIVQKGLEKPYGMILMTGPTGSGKTTTLYALMQILNTEGVNIVSLEDPVEYFIDGLNQSQVKPEIGYDFASGLRQILRQDPDVIMIGEIRDSETAKLAIHSALTGHVVLSTLHTNNAAGVIPRLLDMGVDKFLLPSALNIMAAQRIIGKICGECKEPKDPIPAVLEVIKSELEHLPAEIKKTLKTPYKVFESRGCKACGYKRYAGRIAIFEVFQMTRSLADIISHELNEGKIFDEARRQGMLTLRQDGILKALTGLVSIDDVLRETTETVEA